MKMFVANLTKEGSLRIRKGLGLTYSALSKKKGFKKFWMGQADVASNFNYAFYLAKDVQQTLPVPEISKDIGYKELNKLAKETRIDDIRFIKHPTISDKWMAVHDESNTAMLFFSLNDFNLVFPLSSDRNVILEKDCPNNHHICSSNSKFENICPLCGAKGFRRRDDTIFFKLAEKYGIEVGDGELVRKSHSLDFLHTENGKVKVLTTNCKTGYDLYKTADTKYDGYTTFELTPGKSILIGASVDKNLYLITALFDGTDIKFIEKRVKCVLFDFSYDFEKEQADYVERRLVSSRKGTKNILTDRSEKKIEDSPFAALRNLKFD